MVMVVEEVEVALVDMVVGEVDMVEGEVDIVEVDMVEGEVDIVEGEEEEAVGMEVVVVIVVALFRAHKVLHLQACLQEWEVEK